MASALELRELVELLKSDNPRIIQPACEYFCGLSGTVDGLNFILSQESIFKQLMNFCSHENEQVLLLALKTITNCSQNENGTYFFIACDKEHFCTKSLLDSVHTRSEIVSLASIQLIENLTRIDSGARHVFIFIQENNLFENLFRLLLSNQPCYHDLSLVFGNICQVPAARKLFLQKDGEIFNKVLAFLSHENSSCRLGAANCVKNCCFETADHEWIIKDDSVIGAMLLPLGS